MENKLNTNKYYFLFQNALEASKIWFLLISPDFKILYTNPIVYKSLGYKKEEVWGKTLFSFFPEVFKNHIIFILKNAINKKENVSEVLPLRKKDGNLIHLKQIFIPVTYEGKIYFLFTGLDITQFKEVENKKLYFLDPVLEIYNYFGFKEKSKKFLNNGFKLIGEIHIQNFKSLAERFGFHIANRLIFELLKRLKTYFKDTKVMIGEKFHDTLLFISNLSGASEKEAIFSALKTCHNIIKLLSKRTNIETLSLKAEPLIGASIYPLHGKNLEELLNKAEKVLFSNYLIYDPQIEEKEKKEKKAFDIINKALSQGCFVFYFQPYFFTKSQKLAGIELLTRIIDENGKIISPSVFIKYLENSPLIQEFNEWMFTEIEKIFLKLKKLKAEKLSISVNLAPNEFFKDSFWELFLKFLKKGVVSNLTIEITERIFIENFESLSYLLKMLKKVSPKTKIAIDDFGTGATSFRSILSFPIDVVKIDLLYIQKMLEDAKIACIVESIVNVCKNFKILTVAEGIETEAEYKKVKEMGCDFVQGFYFERPLSEKEFFKKYFLN